MLKNTAQSDRPQMTILCMHIAYWKMKGRNTHSDYVTIIVFALQKWLHESALMLRYTNIAFHVLL